MNQQVKKRTFKSRDQYSRQFHDYYTTQLEITVYILVSQPHTRITSTSYQFYFTRDYNTVERSTCHPAITPQNKVNLTQTSLSILRLGASFGQSNSKKGVDSLEILRYSISEKIKTFLQEFYRDGKDGSKEFTYAQQLVSLEF